MSCLILGQVVGNGLATRRLLSKVSLFLSNVCGSLKCDNEGGTIARKKDSLGDSWSVALADCTLSRGQQHWEIQVLQ